MTGTMLSFTQLNLHKAAQATSLVGRGLENQQQSILLLTEPYFYAGKLVGMPSRTNTIYDHTSLHPRASIATTPDVKVTAMEAWCNRDCAVAITGIGGKRTVIVSLYLDINLEVQPDWLDALMDMIDHKGYPVIMGIDSNAHSTLYGNQTNARGAAFEDFVLQYGLQIENIGLTPTFETMRGDKLIQTNIDVTLTRGIHGGVKAWEVNRDYNGSDHNTIGFYVNSKKPEPELVRPWSKADWSIFKQSLEKAEYRVPEDMSMKKLDKLVDRTYEVLDKALNEACPLVPVVPSVGKSHWATEEHTRGKAAVGALYKKAKRTSDPSHWEEYKKADKAFKQQCKNDKNRAWRKYKECIQTEKEMANLAKTVQHNERREINVLTNPDGTSTDPGTETIDLLTKTHFPAATNTKHVTYNNRRNLGVAAIREKYVDWITGDKIRSALGDFEKKKSPGPDGIKPLVFEYLPRRFLDVIEIIYKSSIHLGYTPKAWKRTKVIFIAKPGKEKYDKPKSFRPISLSNYLLKGLERLVGWRMDKAVEQYPLHHKQHGFMSGKSTESAISNTVNYIEKHIMKKQHCVGVFLDISAAFDSIRPNHVRQALLKHGGDPEMVQWYFNYITHRDIEIEMHGEMKRFSTGIGFPQGGVCSAKFWLIAFDYAIQIINRYNIEGNGYADDCSVLYGGRRLDHALKRLQKMLDDLTRWGERCGLKFNPEKSIAVVFTRRNKKPPFALKIDGREIEYKLEVKYLGVTLDSKLHWNKHIEEKLSKTKKYLTQVAYATRKNWGPKPKLMRWAFIGIVRPMLCYGAMIWGHRAPELVAKFRRINRMAINTFASFPKSTPTTALEIMLDIKPLHLFCVQEALAARIRLDPVLEFGWDGLSHTKTHSTSHMKFLQNKLEKYDINPDSTDRCSVMKWSAGFKINRESFDGSAKHRQPTQFNVFTDGSKLNDQTGSGVVIYHGTREVHHKCHRLPNGTTVFQAEVAAVAVAAETLLNMNETRVKYVKIFVDSQAALTALGNAHVTSKVVAQAIDRLNELAQTVSGVQLLWIPAHKGFTGNERADELAKAGSREEDPGKQVSVGTPQATVRSVIRESINTEWREEWQNSGIASHSKSFYSGPNPGKARFVYGLARLELGRFARIITGHNNLNFFQEKLGLHNTAICRLCGEGNETITHFIGACPVLMNQTGELFADRIPDAGMRWSVRDLLNFSYIPEVNAAYEGSWADGERTCDEEAMDLASSWPWAETGRVTDDNNNGPPATLTITQDK